MQIVDISYGKFPDISFLNPNFRHNRTKIRVVLDIFLSQKKEVNLSSLYRKVHKLMPTLSKHRCCVSLFYGTLDEEGEGGIPLKKIGDITDIAHTMEHMIIDLQANISGMDSCSGITCGYKEPDFRFDLFIECKDKNIARFSSYLTLDIVKRVLSGKKLFPKYPKLIRLAKYLYQNPRRISSFEKISKDLNLPQRSIQFLFKDLVNLRYFSKEKIYHSDTKREEKNG
jgi:hypothetical protein